MKSEFLSFLNLEIYFSTLLNLKFQSLTFLNPNLFRCDDSLFESIKISHHEISL